VQTAGFPVLLVDNNRANINSARMEHLATAYTSIMSEHALDAAEEAGLGRLLAMTADDDVNVLATLHFRELFGRAEVYQLSLHANDDSRGAVAPAHMRGRNLFASEAIYESLAARFAKGQVVKATKLSQAFDYDAFRERYGEEALPLFFVTESGSLVVCTAGEQALPKGRTDVDQPGGPEARDVGGDSGDSRRPGGRDCCLTRTRLLRCPPALQHEHVVRPLIDAPRRESASRWRPRPRPARIAGVPPRA
jgi:hypothetical protein